MSAIGAGASTSGYLSAARGLEHGNYKPQYSAAAVISHVRAGFNMGAEPTPAPTPTPTPTPTTPTPAPTPTPVPIQNAAPTATLSAGTLYTGGQYQEFSVEYKDADGIDVVSTGPRDVRVKGTAAGSSFDQPVTVKAVTPTAGGGVIVTYRVTTPAGNWDAGDNGTYSVEMGVNQVRDTKGTAVKAGSIGTFKVAVGQQPPAPTRPDPDERRPARPVGQVREGSTAPSGSSSSSTRTSRATCRSRTSTSSPAPASSSPSTPCP
jgi:hypothetical protein